MLPKTYKSEEHRIILLERQRLSRIKRRKRVLDYYGGKCFCCNEDRYEFLSIDHIGGGGVRHRASLKSPNIDRFLIKENFPDGYRVLCHNCNFSLGVYNYCPHDASVM